MPFARIDLIQGKPPEYRAAVADIVYQGIVASSKRQMVTALSSSANTRQIILYMTAIPRLQSVAGFAS